MAFDGFSVMAVIPARGGSKGLPNKNILNCAGKPLIAWTIDAALGAASLDEVFVSTDSEEIARVAREAGASVPFLRPAQLATDSASVLNALAHAWCELRDASGKPFDYVVLLQPTSPLRTSSHIEAALSCYFSNRRSENDTLASVYQVESKFGWLMQIDPEGDGYINFCFDVSSGNAQRQQLRACYLPNGAIFVLRGSVISNGLYTPQTVPFVMDYMESIDIDTRDEFDRAECLLLEKKK